MISVESVTRRYGALTAVDNVSFAVKKNVTLSQLSLLELQKFDKKITKDVFLVLSPLHSMKSKTSFGGTSPQCVKKSIQYAIKKYL